MEKGVTKPKMSPFRGSGPWLTQRAVAAALEVDPRTVKRWLKQPESRRTLRAVRRGRQWRIPRPANVPDWVADVRSELWGVFAGLDEIPDVYSPEAARLHLAAVTKVLRRGRLSAKARAGIAELVSCALDVLHRNRLRFGIEKMKAEFPRRLWPLWPSEADFDEVGELHCAKDREQCRQKTDFLQAVRELHHRKISPTADDLRLLLHQDWQADCNDTGEKLPRGVKDFRQPQAGISLREFRRRYPLGRKPWKQIIATIYGHRESLPGSEPYRERNRTPVIPCSQEEA
jgi:hypothetical protein